MLFTQSFLDELTNRAKANERNRMNYDLRNSVDDKSQRMLNAVEPGTQIPIHCHPNTSTTVVIIRGRMVQHIYDSSGNLTDNIILDANGENRLIQIDKGVWHNLESLESGTIIFESKDGIWEPYTLLSNNNL